MVERLLIHKWYLYLTYFFQQFTSFQDKNYLKTQQLENIHPIRFKTFLNSWYIFNKRSLTQCQNIGSGFCLLIKYEELVMHPAVTSERVMKFLGEEWSENLLKRQDGSYMNIFKTERFSHKIVNFLLLIL